MSLPVFINWAGSGVNYPSSANPWSTMPVEVLPGFVFFTPGVSLPAPVLNYTLGSLSREAQVIPSTAINTWNPFSTKVHSSETVLDVIVWDDFNKLWVGTGHSSAAMGFSIDDGKVWVDLATLPSQTRGIAPVGGVGWSVIQGGATNIQFVDLTGAVTDTGTNLGVAFTTGGVGFYLTGFAKAVGFLYDGTNTRVRAYSTVDGTTIVDQSTSLPTAWHNGPITAAFFHAALGPSDDAVVAFGGTAAGTNPSFLLHVTHDISSFTFTDLAVPGSGTTESVRGIAYNNTSALWGAVTYDGTDSHAWTSPDLITWTKTHRFPGVVVGGLATAGPYWVITQPVTYGSTTRYRAFASTDHAHYFGLGSPWTTNFTGVTDVAQGDGNVAMYSTAAVAVSSRCGST